jgi:hypothetical protein
VDLGAYGKKGSAGVFQYSALFQALETQSLKISDDTGLPHSDVTLLHVFVGYRE